MGSACFQVSNTFPGRRPPPESEPPQNRFQLFRCIDSMYLFKLLMRNCTSEECPWLIRQNSLPQTGISFEPCVGKRTSPAIALPTRSDGYLLSFFLARIVRSGGGTFSASAAGPFPLPSLPWQTAQYAVYISWPDAGDVGCTGTYLICFC